MFKLLYFKHYIISSYRPQIKRVVYSLKHVIPVFMAAIWYFRLQCITYVTKMFIHGVNFPVFMDIRPIINLWTGLKVSLFKD